MIRRLSLIVTLMACLGAVAPPALADDGGDEKVSAKEEASEESAKRKSIRKLLSITGTPELGLQIAKRIIEQMKRSHPKVPDKFWVEFEEKMNKKAFIEMMIPAYEEHFTRKEIKELIEFYQTDVGQKYVEKLPELTTESMQTGRLWGRRVGQKVVEKLQAKGYE